MKMLDAYLRKGAQLPTEVSDGRRVVEDVITSSLFSPLKFMSARDAGNVVSWLANFHNERKCAVHNTYLWPRFAVDEKSSNLYSIEPDIVIDGAVDDQPFRWVVEVKWDAKLFRSQIDDQIRICTKGHEAWMHISLVKAAELAAFECPSTSIIQWNQLLATLKNVLHTKSASGACLIWCKDAVAFLERLGVGTFRGFGQLELIPVMPEAINLSIWRGFSFGALMEVTPASFSLQSESC